MPGIRNLTDDERQAAYEAILSKSRNGKPEKGAFTDIAAQFGVHPLTVSRIWHAGQKSIAEGSICANVSSKRKGRCGKTATKIDHLKIEVVPLSQRGTL
jgi:hypothetical protein